MSLSTKDGIPVDLVLEVYQRWVAEDPEGNHQLNAQAQTGLTERWFRRLRSEPDRLVPFESVDRMLTGLGLQHEWPRIMGEGEPEDVLLERYCATCKAPVLAEPEGKRPCVWCGNRTFFPKPPGYVFSPNVGKRVPKHITEEQLERAKVLYYEDLLPLSRIAEMLYPETGYASLQSATRMLVYHFHKRGWPVRRVFMRGGQLGQQWEKCTEELLIEGRGYYAQGYSMRQVINILWPRLGYRTKATAIGVFYKAFNTRGWPRRDQKTILNKRNFKHGRAANPHKLRAGDPGYERLAEYHKEKYERSYYEGRAKCKHEGCPYYAQGRVRKERGNAPNHPEYCRRHEPGAEARRTDAMRRRSERYGEVDVATIRPILDAWKGIKGIKQLHELSGVPLQSLYRWSSPTRWPDGKLIKPDYAARIQEVGLPEHQGLAP